MCISDKCEFYKRLEGYYHISMTKLTWTNDYKTKC